MSATTITTNVHIDDHTPVDIAPLRAGAWTVQFGADAASNVTLFGDPVNLRVIAQRILDGIPAPGEGIDHSRAACPYPEGCTGCMPEEDLEPCGCPTDLVADCGHQEGCERDGFDYPTLVDGEEVAR